MKRHFLINVLGFYIFREDNYHYKTLAKNLNNASLKPLPCSEGTKVLAVLEPLTCSDIKKMYWLL